MKVFFFTEKQESCIIQTTFSDVDDDHNKSVITRWIKCRKKNKQITYMYGVDEYFVKDR